MVQDSKSTKSWQVVLRRPTHFAIQKAPKRFATVKKAKTQLA